MGSNLVSDKSVSRYNNAADFVEANEARLRNKPQQAPEQGELFQSRGIALDDLTTLSPEGWFVLKGKHDGWHSYVIRPETNGVIADFVIEINCGPIHVFVTVDKDYTAAQLQAAIETAAAGAFSPKNMRVSVGNNITLPDGNVLDNVHVWVISFYARENDTSITIDDSHDFDAIPDPDRPSDEIILARLAQDSGRIEIGTRVIMHYSPDLGYFPSSVAEDGTEGVEDAIISRDACCSDATGISLYLAQNAGLLSPGATGLSQSSMRRYTVQIPGSGLTAVVCEWNGSKWVSDYNNFFRCLNEQPEDPEDPPVYRSVRYEITPITSRGWDGFLVEAVGSDSQTYGKWENTCVMWRTHRATRGYLVEDHVFTDPCLYYTAACEICVVPLADTCTDYDVYQISGYPGLCGFLVGATFTRLMFEEDQVSYQWPNTGAWGPATQEAIDANCIYVTPIQYYPTGGGSMIALQGVCQLTGGTSLTPEVYFAAVFIAPDGLGGQVVTGAYNYVVPYDTEVFESGDDCAVVEVSFDCTVFGGAEAGEANITLCLNGS